MVTPGNVSVYTLPGHWKRHGARRAPARHGESPHAGRIRGSTASRDGIRKEGQMSSPFIELTESETSRMLLVNVDRVICVAPHGRGGSFVFLAGSPERIEVEEGPARVSEILQGAGILYAGEQAEA